MRLPQARPELLAPDGWSYSSTVAAASGGRGATWFVGDDRGEFALRRYRRGGLVGRVIRARYLWLGEERTRCFREFRLLDEMQRLGLPAPAPAAARYRRSGLSYRAELLTVRIEHEGSLAESLTALEDAESVWRNVGATIRRFHDAGICHADLNAHNVLVGEHDISLIDFDRGTRREPGSWKAANLARLDRSLTKVALAAEVDSYTPTQRRWLNDGYAGSSP